MSSAIKRDTGWWIAKNSKGDAFRVEVTIEADFAKIMAKLANKAANSKRGMATAMHGAVIVKARKA